MHARQPLPRLWLMTDERMGDALIAAIQALPRGSGVVFRHYATPKVERRALFNRVRQIARARRLTLVLAGSIREAIAWRADGAHGRTAHRSSRRGFMLTAPAHDARELQAARFVDAVFISPLFATRSHIGGKALGRLRFHALARIARPKVIALGGMNATRAKKLRNIHGWAGIDSLTGIRPG